jgi:thiol-disulfide isomerase/thioredoxin
VTIKVQLLVSEWCAPCRGAEEVWRQAAERKDFAFEVLDVGQPEGRTIVARLGVKTVPASVVDGVLKHVGVPSLPQALASVAAALDRSARGPTYVGLTLGSSSGWAIAAAAAYLALGGAALVFGGGIAGDAPWRAGALHLFGFGFVTFTVFGLAEHMLPRFVGRPIRAGALAWTQQSLAHAGLVLLVAGLTLDARLVAGAGGLLAWCSLATFAARLWPVIAPTGIGAAR